MEHNKQVTVILTSCGRFDLLKKTIESFLLHNTYHIKEWYIYEDSGEKVPDEFKKDYPFIKWIEPLKRTGQIVALDTLWSMVTTPYAHCLEDDWLTVAGGFIEESMAILETNPRIMQVWLQHLEPHNQHPVDWTKGYGVMKAAPGLYSGIRFNPSLKRKADYDLIAPFSKHTTFLFDKPWKSEAAIAKVYTARGYKAAILPEVYVKHIGHGRHVT